MKLINKGLPLVFFDRVLPDVPTSKVIQDDYQGAFNTTEHLIRWNLLGTKLAEARQQIAQE